jgi:hypothetical protein
MWPSRPCFTPSLIFSALFSMDCDSCKELRYSDPAMGMWPKNRAASSAVALTLLIPAKQTDIIQV